MYKSAIATLAAATLAILSIPVAHGNSIGASGFHRSQEAVDALQHCLGGQGLPSTEADRRVEKTLRSSQNSVALDLVAIAPEIYNQWLHKFASPVVQNYGIAAHETSHFVNAILRSCFSDRTGFYFFGDVHFLDVRPYETPNYSKVDELLPARLEILRRSFRYSQYILKSRTHRGNDFRILIDEWLSSIVGATVELVSYQAQAVEISKDDDAVLVNADVVGAQEFAVFVAIYLADLKATSPATYRRVICAADGSALLKQAWERLDLVRRSQAQQDRSHFSPRARQTSPEVTEFLTSDAAQTMFMNPCNGIQ